MEALGIVKKLLYPPPSGTILYCNYKDLIAPEMDKIRPVVMLSSVSPNLALVVPLSTSQPQYVCSWHYRLTLDKPISDYFTKLVCWVKCDMVMAVSFDRLSLPREGKVHGKRVYKAMRIHDADLQAIRNAVWQAISR